MSKCLICNEDFSEEFTIPKVLPCGHTSCARCIFERSQTYKAFVCPECGITIRDFNILSRLPTNGALMKMIQQMKVQKVTHSSPSSFFSHPGSNPFMATRDNTINFSPSHDHFFNHSPSHGHHHHNPNDSFNFDNFRAFFEQGTAPRDRTYQRSFTDPRKSRSRTPPRRVNGIEYSEKGVFREKSPRTVDTCDMKMCNYPKMVIKGSKVPFCSFHFNQLNKNGAFGSTTNPMNLSDISPRSSPGFHHGYKSMNTSVMSAPHSSQSQNMLAQLNMMNNSFDYTPAPSQSFTHSGGSMGRPKPQFGKPSALNDLMGYYSETPQSSQDSANSGFENPNAGYKGIAMTNSSVFSGFGNQGSQGSQNAQGSLNTSMTFGKNGWQNFEPKVPFPEVKEKKNKNLSIENKCILPDCENQRLVMNGFTYPVCGKKCFRRWEERSTQGFDWSRTGF